MSEDVKKEDMINAIMGLAKSQQSLVESTKVNNESNTLIKAKMESMQLLIGDLTTKYNNSSDKIENHEERLVTLEYNEEITDKQAQFIVDSVNQRVSELLDHDLELKCRYTAIYSKNLYIYLKRSCGMGSKLRTTAKKDYDSVINGINAWHPNHVNLRKKADKYEEIRQEKKNSNFNYMKNDKDINHIDNDNFYN